MSGPWEDYGQSATAPPPGPWSDYAAPANPPEPASNPTWQNLAAGFGKGVTGGLSAVLNQIVNPAGPAISYAAEALTGKPLPSPVEAATHALNTGLGTVGLNPEQVQARTLKDKLEQGAGMGATAVLFPEAEGPSLARAFGNLAVGALAGTAATGAAEAAPEPYKPLVSAAAGTLAALATGTVLPRAGGAVASAARPFAATAIPAAAERMAGDTILNRATDPEAALAALAGGPKEIVPNSPQTTFQKSGDLGLGSLERETAAQNPAAFADIRGQQNAARVGAMQELSPGASPGDFAGFLRSQLRTLDSDTADHVAGLTAKAQAAVDALGEEATPDMHGQALRGILQDAETAERARERGLWTAVDPKGTLTGNMVETATAAKGIAEGMPSTAKPMGGEEAAIFDAAKGLPPLAPVQDLIALRSRVSTEMRNELIANGRSPSYARLAQLRSAIQSNLSNSIGQAAENEQANVAAGTMANEDTIANRLKSWQDQFYADRAARQAGTVGPESAGTSSGAGPIGPAGANGTALPAGGGLGSATGDQGLSPNAPTFDQAAADRLAAATAATAQRARTFGVPSIKSVLARAGTADVYRLPDSSVAGKFFQPGPKGFDSMRQLFPGANKAEVLPVIRDYAAMTLRRAALKDDGTLDPGAFSRWQAKYADSLRAFPPEIQKQFANAGAASQAVADATELHAAAVKAAQEGAVGRVMKAQTPEDVTRTVGSIFGSANSVGEMQNLARLASRDPDAMAGLKQAVVDHMMGKFISNTEAAASDVNAIKADQFQTFLKTNQKALSAVFSPKEMDSLNAIAADLRQSARSVSAVKLPGGSNTAQDVYGMLKNSKHSPTILRYTLDLALSLFGGHLAGWPGYMAGYIGADALQSLRAAGINNARELVNRAMLDPDLAHALLQKAMLRGRPTWSASVARAVRNSVPAINAVQTQE